MPAPRWRPTASISSMKRIEGADFFAVAKTSRVREAPTPTNISTNSEADIWKKGTPLSPATARARRVFPVPGAPIRSTPRGIRAPISRNFFGFLRKSTTSSSSRFVSLRPATSLNMTLSFDGEKRRIFDLPNENAWFAPPFAWRKMNQKIATIAMIGSSVGIKTLAQNLPPDWPSTAIFTFASAAFSTP